MLAASAGCSADLQTSARFHVPALIEPALARTDFPARVRFPDAASAFLTFVSFSDASGVFTPQLTVATASISPSRQHISTDWGEVSEEDAQENDLSLREGFRLLSAYRTTKGEKIWIMWN